LDAAAEKCLLDGCEKPVVRCARGRPGKFCCDAHRKAHSRLNGQNSPKRPVAHKPQNHDHQVIDIIERICPEIRTYTPSWKRINECTWKLSRGPVTAYVMNVAPTANHPRAWVARYDDQTSNPTTLGEAKSIASQMIRCLPGDRMVDDQIFFLNKWAALFADQRAEDEEKPYVEPIAPKGFRVRLGIMGEHRLQVLGCGFRGGLHSSFGHVECSQSACSTQCR
jgi:hypothetical protein